MFYSHEIWGCHHLVYLNLLLFPLSLKAAVDFFPRLVATVGKTTQKKLTRKAIQEVNVPKACETIIHPGAPLALRLQGNLLYGVSRVFAHQCRYVLSDAEKTQSDMMAFFRVMQTNETDPRAGKARRQQITLQDDPDFDPLTSLPNLDLLSNANDLVFLSTQISTQNNTSQMTPSTRGTSSSGRDHSLMGIDLPQSSHSAASYRLPSDLHQDSPFTKPFDPHGHLSQLNPFDEADLDAIPGIDLNFDADGNLIGFGEPDPELPPLPGSGAYEGQMHIKTTNVAKLGVQKDQTENDNVVVMGEDALPDAEPFPKRPAARKSTSSAVPTSETVETEEARAPARRGRPRKICRMIDHRNDVPAAEFRSWSIDYLANMDANRKPAPTTTLTQARKNAKVFLFDNGLADVGKHATRVVGPLAEYFSGMPLLARLQGREPEQEQHLEPRGRRRVSAEAFEDEQDDQRRVRRRTEGAAEFGRGVDDGAGAAIFGEDVAPEMGMEAAPGLEDRHSSSMAPWSRPPSVAPGSSVRGHGSVQKRHPVPSPLHVPGSAIRSIERWSDLPGLPYESDDFPQLHSQNSSIGQEGFIDTGDFAGTNDTQNSTQGIDVFALDFLGYATARAETKGYTRPRDGADRRWIDFDTLTDELEDPENEKKFVAEAFMHILTLASKNALTVEQDGIAENRPFGTIRIGLAFHQQDDDMVDELA
ncbi:meiotic cohesin rec8 [Fusarium albosuccineum]|uniref:Meiotic cohesin rec8 n=1 Tax=Fusarium albosuccineum TaxID=1237068 RepID=A0A8H4PH76_9HYPO|nr:meiotic cohesin rec8 [Fusarium albosuccineum]